MKNLILIILTVLTLNSCDSISQNWNKTTELEEEKILINQSLEELAENPIEKSLKEDIKATELEIQNIERKKLEIEKQIKEAMEEIIRLESLNNLSIEEKQKYLESKNIIK